jgi:hypothetical protein
MHASPAHPGQREHRFKEPRLSEPKGRGKAAKPSRTLDDEIAEAEARLKALRVKQQQEKEQRDRDANQKDILALIRDEGLDAVPVARWKAVLPQLQQLLKGTGADAAHDSDETAAAESQA